MILGTPELITRLQDTMFVLGGKWKLPIIISIYHGNKRFNNIALSISKATKPGTLQRVKAPGAKFINKENNY